VVKAHEGGWGARSAVGPGRGGAGSSGVQVAFGQGRRGPMTHGPLHVDGFKTRSDSNQAQMNSNSIQFVSNFDWTKRDLPKLKKFKTKYGCEGFEEGNNFLHRNFFKSKMVIELKIWEIKVCF
jgi:hypothetical protein